MGRNQAISAEQVNQCQGLNNGRGHQRHHDDIPEKGLSGNRCSSHGIGIKEYNDRNDNRSGERYIQTMPECV